MKTFKLSLLATTLFFILFTACQQSAHKELTAPQNADLSPASSSGGYSREGDNVVPSTASCNPNAYIITLESKTLVNGNWEWVWSVQNPNPGNGSEGTVQNLSHWGMQFGPCDIISSVTGAAYSPDGVNWTSFTPLYQVDPSQECVTSPVFKFDYGTTGSAKSYYKLILNQDYEQGSSFGYYKSGVKTGCCTFSFTGIFCPVDR